MKILINRKDCEHLPVISCYNNNFYKLSIIINDCNILLEHAIDDEKENLNTIGVLIQISNNGRHYQYIPKFWPHQINENDDYFIFDSETLKDHNEWT